MHKRHALALALALAALGIVAFATSAAGSGRSPSASGLREPARWWPEQRLSGSPLDSLTTFNFSRNIAASGRSVHVVWYEALRRGGSLEGDPLGDGVHYRRSLDGGASFQPEVRLSPRGARAGHPSVAVSGKAVYIAYQEARGGKFEVRFRRSSDGGATWDASRPLSASGAAAHPSLAASGDRFYAVWGDARSGNAEIYLRRSVDRGETWGPERRISTAPYESWVGTVEASGDLVVVGWVDYRDANEEEYVRVSSDGGTTWGPVTRLTVDAGDSWAPSIAIAGATVHVAWFDRRDAGTTDAEVEHAIDAAAQLVGIAVEPRPMRDPAVYYLQTFVRRVEDKRRKVVEAAPGWVQRGGDPRQLERLLEEFERSMTAWSFGWEIYAKRSVDHGRTWTRDVRLTNASGVSARPSIVASGREVSVAWFDARDGGGTEIYFKRSTDRGQHWTADRRLTRAAGDSTHVSAAATGRRVHLVWFDTRHGNAEIHTLKRAP